MRGQSVSQRTLRSKRLRAMLYDAFGGKCAICGCELPDDWHADHVVPWVKEQRTNVFAMQALCPTCNLKKGIREDAEVAPVLCELRSSVAPKE